MMRYERITEMERRHGFRILCWDDRYQFGVWAALGEDARQLDTAREWAESGDVDADEARSYLLSTEWMPYTMGKTIGDALQQLENRLASLPPDQLNDESQWAALVRGAIQALANHKPWNSEGGNKELAPLPKTFGLALRAYND